MKLPHTPAHHGTITILGPVSIMEQPFCCFHESYPIGVNSFNVLQCIVLRTLTNKKVQEQDKNVLFEIIQENRTTASGIMWNYVE
jgi:hypothetical protein